MSMTQVPALVRTPLLEAACEISGDPRGGPVPLPHGWPCDVRADDDVVPPLVAAGARVIVPGPRGFGATRFLASGTPRSGPQAALAADALDLLDALPAGKALLAGYDWGGRAACILAARHPERVRGLVTVNGCNIQDVAASAAPENGQRYGYQWYFHGGRGRAGLARYRDDFCGLVRRHFSPTRAFDDACFRRTAASFDKPDCIDVTIHSHRVRCGLAAGDPRCADRERRLAARPSIGVPAISMDGADDGVMPVGGTAAHAPHFTGPYEYRRLQGIGHALPREAPEAFAAAVPALHRRG